MPRTRYYKKYNKAAQKKKWASHILQGSVTTSNFGVIVENSVGTATPTPVIVKCGNFKVQGDVMWGYNGGQNRPVNINFFLIFVPEGVTPADSLIGAHPEWVIGWKTIDVGIIKSTSEGGIACSNFAFTTRLKRNLNSGDKVVAILQSGDSAASAQCVFTCQYWTCAN